MGKRWNAGRLSVVIVVLIFLHEAAGQTSNQFIEVTEIPVEGATVCVTPHDGRTRIKVLYTPAEGKEQQVLVKKKLLPRDKSTVLQINLEGEEKKHLRVWANGTLLPVALVHPSSPAPSQPRITLQLKGRAKITQCTETKTANDVLGGNPTKLAMTDERGETEESEIDMEEKTRRVNERETVTDIGTEREGESSTNMSEFPNNCMNVTDNGDSDACLGNPEKPWWSFVMVLGSVGPVPVLLLLLGCLVVGLLVGVLLTCFCRKLSRRCCGGYTPVPTKRRSTIRTQSFPLVADFVRNTNVTSGWETNSTGQQTSGIGSACSTLKTDTDSGMGTSGRRGPPMRSNGSGNDLMEFDARSWQTGEKSQSRVGVGNNVTSANRTRSNKSAMDFHCHTNPYPYSHTTQSSNSNGRDMKQTTSSLHYPPNHTSNIPFSSTLGTLTAHLDTVKQCQDSDEDYNDPRYDKPYISSPIVADTYSLPHEAKTLPVVVQVSSPSKTNTTTTTASILKPSSKHVPMHHFETFKK